jgi:hypothetical protein
MGDRSITVFKINDYYSPGIYLHWNGTETLEWIQASVGQLRRGDVGYSAARFCGFCHEQIKGNLSLGLVQAPDPSAEDFDWDYWGPGDNGVFEVDCKTGEVTHHKPYGRDQGTKVVAHLWPPKED